MSTKKKCTLSDPTLDLHPRRTDSETGGLGLNNLRFNKHSNDPINTSEPETYTML